MFSRTVIPVFIVTAFVVGHVSSYECTSSTEENVLQPGRMYTYKFKSEAFGEAVGTTDDRGRMIIECSMDIQHSHNCYYELKLQDCSLSAEGGPPGSEKAWIRNRALKELSEYTLMFALSGGEIKSVYSHSNDPLYSVNVKRGALSAFAFKLSSVSREIKEMHKDIHGTCPYHSLPRDDVQGGVKVSKDMLYCAYPSRKDWQFSPWSIFWNMTFIQYQINSTFSCDYGIDVNEKRIDKVFCKERHAIGLESTHRTTTAVQTNVYYHITHLQSGVLPAARKLELHPTKTGIEYEYEDTPDPSPSSQPESFLSVARKMLSDLVETSQEEIRLFTIPMFTDFVAWLRTSYDLSQLIEDVKSCSYMQSGLECSDMTKELSVSYLSDALIQCNTVPCMKAFSEMAINDQLSPLYLNFALYSLSNMHFRKPEMITHIKNICTSKQSGYCWIMLGSIIHNYHKTTYPVSKQKSKEVDEVVDLMYRNVGMFCGGPTIEMSTFAEGTMYHQITFLKAVGNSHDVYMTYAPGGLRQIVKCITKDGLPAVLKKAAFDALHMMDVCRDESTCASIYRKLRPLLFNTSASADMRIRVYSLFMLTPENFKFEEDLIKLLQTEKNSQVLSYVSSDLLKLMSDNEYRKSHPEFILKLDERLRTSGMELEGFLTDEDGKSYTTSYGDLLKFPFLPEEMQGFGAKLDWSILYPVYNLIPESFKTNVTIQLFNKVINLLEVGGDSEGHQRLGILLKKIVGQMRDAPLTQDKATSIVRDIVLVLSQPDVGGSAQENPVFDESVMNSIRKIVEKYKKNKPYLNPYFSFYFNMLGRTVNFFTSDNLKNVNSLLSRVQDIMGELQEGIAFNNTRVMRVIEAYHQVPTMMGLPLNWTTNATLAFSMRRGLKLDYDQGYNGLSRLSANGFFQPSAALTFLNRMVLDFPTVTQIGVQANSSAYTSTQMKVSLEYSDETNKWKLSIDAPKKSQKLLELFRTNQMIKHDAYEEIKDWNITRKTIDYSFDGRLATISGMQLNFATSFPVVTHLVKPWALMAGSCKWQLELVPSDRRLKSYDFDFSLIPDKDIETKSNFNLHFKAPGDSLQREVILSSVYDSSSGEADISLTVPEIPEMEFTGKRKQLVDKGTPYGLRSTYTVALSESMKYQVTFLKEDKKEKMKEDTTGKNKSPKPSEIVTAVQERLLKLETPFNEYKWVRKMHYQSGNMKADVHISYRNRFRDLNWLARILPQTFWEDKNRAWIQVQLNQKTPTQKSKDMVSRQLTASVNTPKASVDLIYSTLKMQGREQLNLNLTRSEKSPGKLSSYVNFTHDLWISSTGGSNLKQIRSVTFSIPRKSWNLLSQRVLEGGHVNYDIVLTRAVMVPKDPSDQSAARYVGWWYSGADSTYDLQKQEVKFKADIVTSMPDGQQLVNEGNDISLQEVEGLRNKHIKAKLGLYYPVNAVEQVLSFDGMFIMSGSASVFRFQKDFVMFSSYNNLKLTSHSVYRSQGPIQKSLLHNSYFTHTTTDTKAYYNLDLKQSFNQDRCLEIYFNHNITSHVFNMASHVNYHCNADDPRLHLLDLMLNSNSSFWDMLDMKIIQSYADTSPEKSIEVMNFVHPLMYINVSATWDGNEHKKRAVFVKRPENIDLMTLEMNAKRPWTNEIEIDVHDDSTAKFIYQRKLLEDFTKVKMRFFYPDREHEVANLHGKIINPHHRQWTLNVSPQASVITDYLGRFMSRISHGFLMMAHPSHPLNQMLKPAIKVPLTDYISSIRGSMMSSFYTSWLAVKESIWSLGPFLQTPLQVLTNAANVVAFQAKRAYSVIEKHSIGIWAIKYFELPSYFKKGLQNLPEGIKMWRNIRMHMYDKPDSDSSTYIPPVQKFVLNTGRILTWNSFKEMPFLDIERMKKQLSWSQSLNLEVKPHHEKSFGSKIAMIFGPRHVYTFDGLLYEFPEYPSNECAYLLAHDLQRSLFSVFTTPEHIHVIFPEMAVSIGPDNDVYVNGSKTEISMPIQSKNEKVTVKREGNIVSVWSPVLTMLCESKSQLCTLELNGWSGGLTLGLLGNADGESHNDFMLPDGTVSTDVIEAARSYELTGNPQCNDLKQPVRSMPSSEHEGLCSASLEKVCAKYNNVKEKFMQPCLTDLATVGHQCYTLPALSSLCFHEGEIVENTCHVAQQENKHIRHKLQVVLLVNEQQSMMSGRKTKLVKGLESLLRAVDQQFESSGYANIAYSLIGFGGSGVHYAPTIHTVESKVWVPARLAINNLLKDLTFRGRVSFNPVEAIKYAVESVGHDTFDTKVFVIITDSETQNTDPETVHLVQQYLEKNHITLYAIGNYSSIEKGKKVYGVRADGMIFPSGKDGEAFLEYPRGDIPKLVSGTRGSLFLKKFADSNGPASFFNEIATEIWAKVRREVELCRNCKTVRSGWWYYYNECTVVDC